MISRTAEMAKTMTRYGPDDSRDPVRE